MMAAAGVVHEPGMAAKLLKEIAPLLADEGFDLDALGETEGDLDALQAALERATERYNLELFTPVGRHRTQALRVLRQFCEALEADDDELAADVLAAVQPEPSDDQPAVSHVIGLGVGLLDRWHTDPATRAGLRTPHVPVWEPQSQSAATSILAWARAGQAFDGLDDIIVRFRGLDALEGTALAVAACVEALAEADGVTVTEMAAEVLREGAPEGAGAARPRPGVASKKSKPGRGASGNPAKRAERASEKLLFAFDQWLRDEPEISAPTVEGEMALFDLIRAIARQEGLDPYNPRTAARLVEAIVQVFSTDALPGTGGMLLTVLDDFMHFRMEVDGNEAWDPGHDAIAAAMEALNPGRAIIDRALEEEAEIDPDEVLAACAATRVVAMVTPLLDWIGSGRGVTASAGIRRADIAEVAALLGIKAVGVSKRSAWTPDQAPLFDPDAVPVEPVVIEALSMFDVPILAAWWEALRICQVIHTSATRVKPGSMASVWLADDQPPVELAKLVLRVFITGWLALGVRGVYFGEEVMAMTVAYLVRALEPTGEAPEPILPGEFGEVLAERVQDDLRELVGLGVLESDESGFAVPLPLRGIVARGILDIAGAMETDEDDEYDE